MNMDFSRIRSVIDVERTTRSHIAIVGTGGSVTLICDFARSGVAEFTLIDPDRIEPSNVTRQDHFTTQIGMEKVRAVAEQLRRINPDVVIHTLPCDFCGFTDAEIDFHFASVDLLIMATDSFPAQARGNAVALRLGIPVVIIGLYEGGQGAEVFFWHPGLISCFRCIAAARYSAYAQGTAPAISSRGASIFDIRLPDAIAGMIGLGLLTRGADHRFGRLVDQLGDRNFLQVKIDPEFTWNGRDIFREQLGIPADRDSYFSFVTLARRDPDGGQLPCLDCQRYRGHRFLATTTGFVREVPDCPHAVGVSVEPELL